MPAPETVIVKVDPASSASASGGSVDIEKRYGMSMSFEFFTYRKAGVPLVQPVAIAGFFEEDVP
jgi:hypothetical protein